MNNYKILVIIVTYNAMKWAERCFFSLKNSTIPNDVFVVDNGSTDGTQQYIKQNFPEFSFHQSESNLGFGKANNLGLEYALKNDYDYVYLLNQDAWIESDTFEILINIHQTHPEYGIISPLQRNGSRKFDDNFFATSMSNEAIFDQLFPDKSEDLYETKFVMAAHWLVSKECLKRVGGFSPSFPHYGEDDNFINRCVYHGLKVGYTFKTMAVHDRESRPSPLSKLMYMQHIRHIVAYSNPNKPLPSLCSILYVSIKTCVKLKTILPIKYFVKLLRNKKQIIENRALSQKGASFINV